MAQLGLTSICLSSNSKPSFIPHESTSLSSPSHFQTFYLPTLPLNFTSLSLYSISNPPPILCSSSSTLTTESPLPEINQQEISPTRLLVQNVPWSSTADDIRALFQNYGTVVDVELSMHNKTRNRGLAFVEMGSAEEAAEALAKLEAYEFEGRTLYPTYAKPKKKTSPPVAPKPPVLYNLFVANLPFEARSRDLKEFFQSNGSNVVSADIIYHENPRRSSGYGFVSFQTKKEADEALSNFEGKELMGRPIRVARSKRFVNLKTEMRPPSEDDEDTLSSSDHESDDQQPEVIDNLRKRRS